jgi:hypothetical protein
VLHTHLQRHANLRGRDYRPAFSIHFSGAANHGAATSYVSIAPNAYRYEGGNARQLAA